MAMPLALGVAFVHAHVGDLRVGVGGPRHDEGTELLALVEEGVLDDDARGRVRGVGELPVHAHVAAGEDARVGGLEVVVDHHAAERVELDADAFEVQPVHVGGAPGSHQDLVHRHRVCVSVRLEMDHLAAVLYGHAGEGAVEHQLNALAQELLLDDFRGVGVLAVEDVAAVVEQHHLAAQALEGLRQLAADGAGADDRQPFRALREGEDRLVGEVARLLDSLDGRMRRHRPGAGGDDRLLEAQGLAVHLHGLGAGEAGVAQEHVHPQLAEALHRVVVADVGADAAHAFHHRGEVHLHVVRPADAEQAGVADLRHHARRADDALGRDAADVQAVAAQVVALDQGDLGAQAGGARRGHQPGRAGADHHQVVAAGRGGIGPVRRVRVGAQHPVVFILRRQLWNVAHDSVLRVLAVVCGGACGRARQDALACLLLLTSSMDFLAMSGNSPSSTKESSNVGERMPARESIRASWVPALT